MPSTTPDLRIAAGRNSSGAEAGGVSDRNGLSFGASVSAGFADPTISACSSDRRAPRLGQTASNGSGWGARDFARNKKSSGGFLSASPAPVLPAGAAPLPLQLPPPVPSGPGAAGVA